MSKRTPLALLAFVTLSSCPISLPPLLAPGNAVDFCIEQSKSYCALLFRCCTAVERQDDPLHIATGTAFFRHKPSDEGECVTTLSDVCRGIVEEQNEAVKAERMEYRPADAAGCLDELHKDVDACKPSDFFDDDGSYIYELQLGGQPGVFGTNCEDALRPKAAAGDECFATYECKQGTCVVTPNGNDVTLKGQCQGDGRPTNEIGNIKLGICDGLSDSGG